jgi:hypothetical protein
LGTVHGRITLDGVALADAVVSFKPEGAGRDSTAVTDLDGRYTLNYIREIAGAAVSWHLVRITTGDPREGKPEAVPARYNTRSQLRKQVVAGDNTIDFELTTK